MKEEGDFDDLFLLFLYQNLIVGCDSFVYLEGIGSPNTLNPKP
jgi:hypothetical protein